METDETMLVKSVYDAFGRGDVASVLGALDPDVEWVTPPSLPWSRGRYVGHAGVHAYFASFLSALDAPRIEPETIEQGGSFTWSVGVERARVRATGAEFEARFVHLFTIRQGRIVRMEGIVDTASIRDAFR